MFTIKNQNENEYDFNNCVFSTSISRPSKSLINCELYKIYSKININLDILNEFSYLNNQSKKIEYFLLKEIINIFKLNIIKNESLSLSFDTIIINEILNNNNENINNIIFCFDTDISLYNIVKNILILIKELQNNNILLINFTNLFTYTSIELLYIISQLFKKVKIYYCKLLKQNILYCANYNHNSNITIFLKSIFRNWKINTHIRQFGIYIEQSIINKIKIHNDFIMNYYININNNISQSTLEEKEYFFKNYIKKHTKNIHNCFECNHQLKELNLFKCMICCKCYDLFLIY